MPVDYAEATKLQDFKVDVYKSSDAPQSQPTAPSPPAPPSQLSVPDRDTGLGKPNNLPERQNSLRDDGQYRTVDVTPETTAKSPPAKRNNQLPSVSLEYRTQFGDTNGGQAIALAFYYAGFFTYGLSGGEPVFDNRGYKRTPTEETADEVTKLGKQSGQQVKDAVDNSKKLLDDLWRNKPTFEIPQIKIPKFDLPELPDLTPPKFPDFKFPEISFPEPQPIDIPQPKPPKQSLTDIVKDIDIINCGGVTMKVAFVSLIIGDGVTVDNGSGGYYVIPNRRQSDIETFMSASIRDIPEFASGTLEGLLEGGGQTGYNPVFKDEDIEYTRFTFVSPSASLDGHIGFYQGYRTYYYPYYEAVVNTISIPSGISVKKVLSHLSQSDIQPEVYYLSSQKCLFPLPPPPPPPPPPPEDDCCRMGCCPKPTEIDYKLIKQLIDKSLK